MNIQEIIKRKFDAVRRLQSESYYLGFIQGFNALENSRITAAFMPIDVIKNQKEFDRQRGLFDGWLFIHELRLRNKKWVNKNIINRRKKSRKPKKRQASKSDAGVIDVD
jgi:hypothetical protein